MYCPKCGAENVDGVQLCKSCSWVLASTVAAGVSEDAKTSGLAITSLVLMILSLFTFFLTALPAVIFGIVALVKIGKSSGQLKGKGLAIAGIAGPAVMLPIAAMLMAILMPALAVARQTAGQIVCSANLISLGTTMQMYEQDYGQLPAADQWCDTLVEYIDVNSSLFVCRGAQGDGPSTYAMNENAVKLGDASPAEMVLLFETSQPGWNLVGGKELLGIQNHRKTGANVLFIDGRVEFIRAQNLELLRWD